MTETLELSVAGVQKRLSTAWLGRSSLAVLQETTSTNRVLLADLDAPHGAVLAAEGQREGRGRGDRVWYGTPGKDLLFSCLLLPDAPLVRLPALTLAAGLAAFDLAVDSGARTVELKWPNDVLLNGKKACGILCQTITAPRSRIVVGIGLNVNSCAADRPPSLFDTSISLAEACGVFFQRDALLARFLGLFERYYALWLNDFPELLAAWEARADLVGKTIKVLDGREAITAPVVGFDIDGHPLVAVDGRLRSVIGGELVLLEETP